jgi:hypothetical protein
MSLRSAKYVSSDNKEAHVKEPNKEHDKGHAGETSEGHMAGTKAKRHGKRRTNRGAPRRDCKCTARASTRLTGSDQNPGTGGSARAVDTALRILVVGSQLT